MLFIRVILAPLKRYRLFHNISLFLNLSPIASYTLEDLYEALKGNPNILPLITLSSSFSCSLVFFSISSMPASLLHFLFFLASDLFILKWNPHFLGFLHCWSYFQKASILNIASYSWSLQAFLWYRTTLPT